MPRALMSVKQRAFFRPGPVQRHVTKSLVETATRPNSVRRSLRSTMETVMSAFLAQHVLLWVAATCLTQIKCQSVKRHTVGI